MSGIALLPLRGEPKATALAHVRSFPAAPTTMTLAMHRHRLAQEADAYRLPVPPEPPLDLTAFALVPVAPATSEDYALLLAIYRAALDEARAVVRPSVLERNDLEAPN